MRSIKIELSEEAEKSVQEMLKKVNEGFRGGRVSRNNLVCWVVQEFGREGFEAQIEAIRRSFFDQVAYLSSVLRDMQAARKSGRESEQDIASILAPIGAGGPRRGRPRKPAIGGEQL